MKNMLVAVALISAGSAFAQGWRGGHGGGHHRGGGGYHSARPVYVRPAPRPVYVAPRPVYVRPRRVYVAPPPPVYVAPPRYRPSYSYGYVPAPGLRFALPLGAISLFIGAQPYFLSGGTFYLQSGQGYAPVGAPIGAAVSVLPPDAIRHELNGYTYASSNGAWFVWDGARGAWVVVNSPY